MNNQGDTDKWENVSELLEASEYPTSVWIALGAGEYTDWGMQNFLQPKDEAVVIIYDERICGTTGPTAEQVQDAFEDRTVGEPDELGFIALHQTFVEKNDSLPRVDSDSLNSL